MPPWEDILRLTEITVSLFQRVRNNNLIFITIIIIITNHKLIKRFNTTLLSLARRNIFCDLHPWETTVGPAGPVDRDRNINRSIVIIIIISTSWHGTTLSGGLLLIREPGITLFPPFSWSCCDIVDPMHI
jgi:hypothetical protein